MKSWTWAAASCRGTSHIRADVPRQDAFRCRVHNEDSNLFVAVICDGAGSAVMGGQGAALTCKTIYSLANEYWTDHSTLPLDETIYGWVAAARERILIAAMNRNLISRDFATTLLCLLSTGSETVVAHIGDGSAVVKSTDTDEWLSASWPSHGEYASTTFFVTDEPDPSLKVSRLSTAVSALALFSDGIERLALDMAACEPYQRFFDGIIQPIANSQQSGRDASLCLSLSNFLESDQVNERTDDDKTLILAVRQ